MALMHTAAAEAAGTNLYQRPHSDCIGEYGHRVCQYQRSHSDCAGTGGSTAHGQWQGGRGVAYVSTGHRIHPEIKHKQTHSWYKVYGDCVFLCLTSQCSDCIGR
eukprot:3620666-Rhodomonas_salina.1